MLVAALADHVELRVVADRPLDEPGEAPRARAGSGARRRGRRRGPWRSRRVDRRCDPCPPTVAADRVSSPVAVALRSCHESAASRCRGSAADSAQLGEPRRAPDPRGDGRRRVRGPAVPGRTAAARGRFGGGRVGDGPSHAAQRRHGPALDRIGQGGAHAAGGARGADRARTDACRRLATVGRDDRIWPRIVRGGQPGDRAGSTREAPDTDSAAASPGRSIPRPRRSAWSGPCIAAGLHSAASRESAARHRLEGRAFARADGPRIGIPASANTYAPARNRGSAVTPQLSSRRIE